MPDAQPVPVNAKFEGDFVTQLVVVLDTDTMEEVAAKVAHHVVGKRLPKRDADMVVSYQGRELPPGMTVAEAGIAPLQNIFVDWVESAPIRPANDAPTASLDKSGPTVGARFIGTPPQAAGRAEKGVTP